MKKVYDAPEFEVDFLPDMDIVTLSGSEYGDGDPITLDDGDE